MSLRGRLMVALLTLALVGGVARADDADVQARLTFLETRLRVESKWSEVHFVVWTFGYYFGAVFEAGRAVMFDIPYSSRVDLVISAIKATLGATAHALRPPKTMFSAEELAKLPESSPDERARKLEVAERLLKRNAKECDQRYSWIAHSVNVALNVAGGLIVWLGYHDFGTGLESALVGIGVGELQIWSQPWNAKIDLRDYRRRFGDAKARAAFDPARLTWSLSPGTRGSPMGATLGFTF
ncbi:MAG TPA: hypothetical protein VFF06_23280 [Polyangia bacterium]|nr:hypothetical protein [Polyangia bacterium]